MLFIGRIHSFLGHGRALEAYLAAVLITWGIQIVWSPEALKESLALRDFYYSVPNWHIAIPILVAGIASATGLVLNIYGCKICRWFRVAGAFLAMCVWGFMLTQIVQENGGYGGAMPHYIWDIPACLRLLYLGAFNLPPPGAAGQWSWPLRV